MNWRDELLGREQRIITYSSPDMPLLKRIIINSVELMSARPFVEDLYEKLRLIDDGTNRLWHHIFPLLDIDLNLDGEKTNERIMQGPLVFIANHPFGILDGMALAKVMSIHREQFKLLVNEVLCREPILGRYFLPIDFREDKNAQKTNIASRSMALSYLKEGGAIGIFPSGGVATTPTLFSKQAQDLAWKRFVIKMIRQSQATVVPIYFEGQNSRLFQVASHIHPNFRLGLLLHELMNKRHQPLRVCIGQSLRYVELPRDNDLLLSYLYEKTHELRLTI